MLFVKEQEKGGNRHARSFFRRLVPFGNLRVSDHQRSPLQHHQHLEVLCWLQAPKRGVGDCRNAVEKEARGKVDGFASKTSSSLDLSTSTSRNKKTQPQAILVAGVGFFSDAYDLFIIGLAKPAIGVVYFPENGGKLPTNVDLAITGVSLIGALTGQVLFG